MTSVAPAVRYNPEPVVIRNCKSVEMVKACEAPFWEKDFHPEGFAMAVALPLVCVIVVVAFFKYLNSDA